jgi:hypothetical protein
LTAQVRPAAGVVLSAGAVRRPAANTRFVRLANGICDRAAAKLAGLPPFPFPQFDPLHPDPTLLPQVGAFLTGAGDPRPTLAALAADVPGFVHTVRESTGAFRRVALTASTFGATRCVL